MPNKIIILNPYRLNAVMIYMKESTLEELKREAVFSLLCSATVKDGGAVTDCTEDTRIAGGATFKNIW